MKTAWTKVMAWSQLGSLSVLLVQKATSEFLASTFLCDTVLMPIDAMQH